MLDFGCWMLVGCGGCANIQHPTSAVRGRNENEKAQTERPPPTKGPARILALDDRAGGWRIRRLSGVWTGPAWAFPVRRFVPPDERAGLGQRFVPGLV